MNYFLKLLKIDFLNIRNIRYLFFYLGIFLIPSAISLAIVFLFVAFLISNFTSSTKFFQEKWNIPFFISGILMIISSLLHNSIQGYSLESWSPHLSYIGLLNWIPLFWIFWSSQNYLITSKDRKIFSFVLIAGTLPVLISGFAQYHFNIFGPFETLYGLIIWYQRETDPTVLTSLFNNQNYAGAWLCVVLPLSIASFLEFTNLKIKKWISLLFLLSIGWSILLTNSRSAWGSFLVSIPVVIGIDCLRWLIPILIILSIFLLVTVMPSLSGNLQDFLREMIPNKIWMEFSSLGFESMDISRVGIWSNAFKNILYNPFFGYGGGSFPAIFESQTGFWKGHAHNLPLEIAFSYGLPSAIIITFTIFLLLIKSFKKIYFISFYEQSRNKDYFTKAWWASIFILFMAQQIDVHYFDGRISIIFWIFLAGLKNIICTKEKN